MIAINYTAMYILPLLFRCDIFVFHYAVVEAFKYFDNILHGHDDTTTQPTNDELCFFFTLLLEPRLIAIN